MQSTIVLSAALAGSLLLGSVPFAAADDKAMIDANTVRALDWLRASEDTAQLLERAAGVLVFPDIVEMGFGVGGEFGEGSLLVDGRTIDYYATAGSTFGMAAGSDYKAEVIFFMTREALEDFRERRSVKVGEHLQVPLAVNGRHALQVRDAHVGMVFSDGGPVAGPELDGDRITRILR
ncbi:MAG: YSC84-related protein [Halioglobus sp.]|nr:YSC84-related protein [Halioglobus sp.]